MRCLKELAIDLQLGNKIDLGRPHEAIAPILRQRVEELPRFRRTCMTASSSDCSVDPLMPLASPTRRSAW